MDQATGDGTENRRASAARRGMLAPRPFSEFLAAHLGGHKLRLPFFLLGHAGRHLRLLRLMRAAGIRARPASPSAASYRYLRVNYLGGGLPLDTCLSIATSHYRHLASLFSAAVLGQARRQGCALWEKTSDDHRLDIILRYPYEYNFDADLCLTMGLDGKDIYILSFSLCHGRLIGAGDDQVLLIASIQGQSGKMAQIRQATAACQDIAPPQLLLAAAEALAQAVGIAKIAGAGAGTADEAMPDRGAAPQRCFDYDMFWRCITGASIGRRWYVMALPFEDKPIVSVAAKHRGRTRTRRAIRDQFRADILQQARARLLS